MDRDLQSGEATPFAVLIIRHMLTLSRVTAALSLVVAAATSVQAQIMNTGVGAGSTDAYWTVSAFNLSMVPTYGPASASVILNPPSAPWAPNDGPTSRWIGVNTAGSVGSASIYHFQTSLLGSAPITGSIGWDNQLLGYEFLDASNNSLSGLVAPNSSWLMDVPSGSKVSGFCRDGDGVFPSNGFPGSCLSAFTLSVAQYQGATSIRFVLQGDGSTDGLRIANAATSTVPEPSTYALMAAGLMAMAAVARRRRSV